PPLLFLPGAGCLPAAAQPGARSGASSQAQRASSLAGGIRAASPAQSPVIAVGAERAPLLVRGASPAPGLSLDRTAAFYGYAARRAGTVFAIAPQTRIALSRGPAGADVFKNAPPHEGFLLLAAALTDPQRSALFSERGLGVDDLTTP